jgi:uncharacterized protein (TIGR02453 family)
MSHFEPALFKYLSALKRNNNRDWFKTNKSRYEDVLKDPALAFISDFGPHLLKISKHFVADPRPVGGSLFRIYRDTRFAKDKTPYKTAVGIHFRHEAAKDAHAPGFYLHIAKGDCFVGMGLWTPETAVAHQIRDAIAEDPKRWKRAVNGKKFKATYTLGGESLKRPPRGFDKDHPLIEDLKRKSFMATTKLSDKQIVSDKLLNDLAAAFKTGSPLVSFLCKAVDVPF